MPVWRTSPCRLSQGDGPSVVGQRRERRRRTSRPSFGLGGALLVACLIASAAPAAPTESPTRGGLVVLELRKSSKSTAKRLVVEHDPVPGAKGFRLSYADSLKRARTRDGARTEHAFPPGADWYEVEALGVRASGMYPRPAPLSSDIFFLMDFEHGTFSKNERGHDLTRESVVVTMKNPSGFLGVGKMVVSAKSCWPQGCWPSGSSSRSGQASFVGLNPPKPWELNGETAWYRGMFLLPSGKHPRYPGRYRYPARRQASGKGRGWTILWQLHEFQSGHSSNTIFLTSRGLEIRSVGGVYPGDVDYHVRGFTRPKFDKWHEFVVRATWTWEKDKGGRMDVWVNEKHLFPTADMPSSWRTQWYRPDGETKGYEYLQYGQYRADPVTYVGLSEDYEDTVYITPLIVGPTRKSVGG
jgi:hypothetical protein